MNAYERHQRYIRDYVLYYGRGKLPAVPQKPTKSDYDILKQQYRFIRTEEDDRADDSREAWEKRLARRYYERLYREYCIADLTRYREGQVGMRWRVEKEVIIGKGQFICGNKHCEAKEDLKSYEVNFQYAEAGETKNALVKLRLCLPCAYKLNYKKEQQKKKEEKKRKRKVEKEERKLRKKMKKEGREDELDEMERKKAREAEELAEQERIEREEKEKAEREAEKAKNVWKKDAQVEQTKNRSEEFEDYFRGLFP